MNNTLTPFSLYQRKTAHEIFNKSNEAVNETPKKKGVIGFLKDESGHVDDDTACCMAAGIGAACCLLA